MNRQLTIVSYTMVICRQLILIHGKYTIYSNKAVKHLTHLTQHVPQNKANISLCYPLASYKWKDFGATLQHMWLTCVLIVCCFHLLVNPAGHWRAGAYTKRNMLTEIDHIGHKFEELSSEASRKHNEILALFRGTCWMKRIRCLSTLLE